MTEEKVISFSSRFEMQETITFNLWVIQKFFKEIGIELPIVNYKEERKIGDFIANIYFETENGKVGWIICQKVSNKPEKLDEFLSFVNPNENNILLWISEKWKEKDIEIALDYNEKLGRKIVYPLRIRLMPDTPGRYKIFDVNNN